MSNNNRIQITELDFDVIKQNLKTFLRSQSQFQDYDFEGSGLSVLLDVLAYNTHYNAFYLNMIANEAFLDSALLRDSIVSHAKTLGYTPYSTIAARATISVNVETESANTETLTIAKGHTFKSSLMDSVSYNFVVLEDVTINKTETYFLFENLEIVQGDLITYRYVYDQTSNPKSIFEIPDENVDLSTLKVTVQQSLSNTSTEVYQQITDVLDVVSTTKGYFVQETRNRKYQIYFGDDVLGAKLNDGSVIIMEYVVTSGSSVNGVDAFKSSDVLGDNDYSVQITTNYAATGGSERENTDQIKYLAPSQFTSQNRLVTFNDYTSYILSRYPYVDSISVWGGEDEVPVIFGKVFVSLKPKQGYYISENEKQRILDDIIKPKSMPTIINEIRDPEYLYLLTESNISYRKNKTALSSEGLAQKIRTTILSWADLNLNKFSTNFVASKLEQAINESEPNAIIGTDTHIMVQKRFSPTIGSVKNYTINFNIPLAQSSYMQKITSTEFVVLDSVGNQRTVLLEEVPKSYSGVSQIQIVDPGTGYTSAPTVTITGDGQGATAIATIKYGRLESVILTNPGTDYTKVVVTISGGGGYGATVNGLLDIGFGTLRTVYYNTNSERVIVNRNAGNIDYQNGIITLNDLTVLSNPAYDGYIRINCSPQSGIIKSIRNNILTIDSGDPQSTIVNLDSVV